MGRGRVRRTTRRTTGWTNGERERPCGPREVERLRLSGSLANEIGQRRDFLLSEYAIVKVAPEGDAQLVAGFLQADEAVTITLAQPVMDGYPSASDFRCDFAARDGFDRATVR